MNKKVDSCISPKKVDDIFVKLKKTIKRHHPDMTDEQYTSLLYEIDKFPAAATMMGQTLVIINLLIN